MESVDYRQWFRNNGKALGVGLAAVVAGLALVLFLGRPGLVLIDWRWLAILALPAMAGLVTALAWKTLRPDEREDGVDWIDLAGLALTAAMAVYLASSAMSDRWFYFLRWLPGEDLAPHKAGVVRLAVGATVLAPLLAMRFRRGWLLFLVLFIVVCFVSVREFWMATGGAAVYRDDHPSFMYRFWSLSRALPSLSFYDPNWNGGKLSTYALSTGVLPLTLLLWPVWRFLPIETVYTPALAAIFLVGVPLLTALAVRLAGGRGVASWSGALLGLCVSQFSYMWLMHFGTVAAAFSMAMMPVAAAALYGIMWRGIRNVGIVLLLAGSLATMALWPPGALMAIPLCIAALASIHRMDRRAWMILVFAAAGTALMVGIPYLSLFLNHSDLAGFVSKNSGSNPGTAPLIGFALLADHLRQANPILVFLGLVGVWFLPGKGMRRFFGVALTGLALMAGWGEAWKPQLQLSRTGIAMFHLAVIPAALWIERLWQIPARRAGAVKALVVVLLLLGGLNVARLYGNKGTASYVVLGSEIHDLAGWIRAHTPEDGRVMFAGAAVHGYGRGHIACLPALTGREMMACDYSHFSPSQVEYDYPPRAFRETDADVLAFMELYGAGYAVTFREGWKKIFRRMSNRVTEVHQFGRENRKSVFDCGVIAGKFLKGSGRVESAINRLRVTLDEPAAEVVLRYNWANGMRVTSPAELFAYAATNGVSLIGVRPNGSLEFTVGR